MPSTSVMRPRTCDSRAKQVEPSDLSKLGEAPRENTCAQSVRGSPPSAMACYGRSPCTGPSAATVIDVERDAGGRADHARANVRDREPVRRRAVRVDGACGAKRRRRRPGQAEPSRDLHRRSRSSCAPRRGSSAVVLTGMKDNAIYSKPVDELVAQKASSPGRAVRAEGNLVHGIAREARHPLRVPVHDREERH